MQSIQALRERRAAIAQSIHKLLDDHPGEKWTAALQEKYDQGMAEIEAIAAEASRVQAVLDLIADNADTDAVRTVVDRAARDQKRPANVDAFWKLMKNGEKLVTPEEWAVLRNTMSVGTSAQGGYTVPTEVATSVADALKAYGGMRDVADVFRTAQGNDINFPTSDGTTETGELIGENTTATGADPSFGVVTLKTYKFSSKIVAVPFELLQDTSIDMEGFITTRLVTRLGRVTNTYFTTGTGISQPNGIVTAASAGKTGTTGQTTTVIFDDLIDLIHSVDPAYRALGRCKFMLNDASLKIIHKLKDTAGRPIFLPGYDGLAGPMADTLMGYPIQINQDIAVMAANAKSILFGDFSTFYVRDVNQVRIDSSEHYAFANDLLTYRASMRTASGLIDLTGSIKAYFGGTA